MFSYSSLLLDPAPLFLTLWFSQHSLFTGQSDHFLWATDSSLFFSRLYHSITSQHTQKERVSVRANESSLSLSPTHSHSLRFWLSLFGHDENGRLLGLIRWGMLLREETPFCRRCSLKKTVPSSSPYVIQSPPRTPTPTLVSSSPSGSLHAGVAG